MNLQRQPTQQDIANACNVSKATVSLALRNHPSLPEETRKRIREMAEKMGYHPNPYVTALMGSVRKRRFPTYRATIGWLVEEDHAERWKSPGGARQYWEGAKKRAEQLGYSLDILMLEPSGVRPVQRSIASVQRIMKARGIHGIVLPELGTQEVAVAPWKEFSVSLIGTYGGKFGELAAGGDLAVPGFNTVQSDSYHNMQLAISRLEQLGYQRIGLYLTPWHDARHERRHSACYSLYQDSLPPERRVPELVAGYDAKSDVPPKKFVQWLRTYKPDVVLCLTRQVAEWTRSLKISVPDELGLAHLDVTALEEGWSGINTSREYIGAAALDLVADQLAINEPGLPLYRKTIQIQGSWVDGQTTRQVR